MSKTKTDDKLLAWTTVSVCEVLEELARARASFQPMASAHEGYAILLEEVDELWDEVKKSPKKRDPGAMRKEAIQTAAMAIRFLEDVCDADGDR